MRLRYLQLYDEPPLQNISIDFTQEPILGRNCAIRFVVGVNGSGKSRLLRAIAQTFLALEQREEPPFPITLVYDLSFDLIGNKRLRTVYLHYHPEMDGELVWQSYEDIPLKQEEITDWTDYLRGFTPIPEHEYGSNIEFLLPQTLLAYSSGLTRDWDTIFSPSHKIQEEDQQTLAERPSDWDIQREIQHLLATEPELAQTLIDAQSNFDPSSNYAYEESVTKIGYFINSSILRLAVCAVTLHQALEDFNKYPTEAEEYIFRQRVYDAFTSQKAQSGLRGLLDEIGWLWPVTLTLTLNPDGVERDKFRQFGTIQNQLREIATVTHAHPDPSPATTFVFDLRAPLSAHVSHDTSTLNALLEYFGSLYLHGAPDGVEAATAFDIFRQLYRWHTAGYLRDLTMGLQKVDIEDLLLYDWLSDGEQLFLGRMALFHLLQDEEDALIILDEPETHFNDVWKRRIVDIIDDSLRDQHHEVIISTHSSIALTDVFDTEITLLKNGGATRPAIRTFGASPSQLMIYLFDAPDSMGQRAMEYLDEQLDRTWTADDIPELDNLLENLATGYHRAELRAIRSQLNAA